MKIPMIRFPTFMNDKRFPLLLALGFFLFTFLVYYLTRLKPSTSFNYFVWLADAFLHGRLYLTEPPSRLTELIPVNGKFYVVYPPMPAVILMPFVFFWGTNFSQTLGSVIFGSVNVSLFYLLTRRLTKDSRIQIWMTLLFGFGTIHWYLASSGSAWYFAHVTSFLFLTFAIHETLSGGRPFLVGLFLGASYWARLSTILSFPFFLVMLSDKWLLESNDGSTLKRINSKPLVHFGLGVGVFVLLNFAYNFLRFGTPFDIAYSMLKITHQPWFKEGLFSLSYIPYHLSVLFAKLPVFTWEPPYVVPSLQGMSILITTPATVYVILAGIKNRITLACWLGIIPVALLIFTKSGTGWTQFGYRYAMDFYPFLLLLILKGIGSEIRWHHKLLISLGILVNLWGVLWVYEFGWFMW
jgi:hypothetical protein